MRKVFVAAVVIILLVVLGIFLLNQNYGKTNKNSLRMIPSNEETFLSNSKSDEKINEKTEKTYYVYINDYQFVPNTINITEGDSVVWINNDSASHSVTSVNGKEINSNRLTKGMNYSVVFNNNGIYQYQCTFHTDMTGKVFVR